MIARSALESVDPRVLVARALNGEPGAMLHAYASHFVCAVGKAAGGMLDGFERAALAPIVERMAADSPHPTPTEESCRTARRACELAERVESGACLVLLVSGGASAMLALPAEGVPLDDKIATVKLMLARGVPIEDMNAVRKHLSAVKGGWLAARARACCTLAISDVIGPAEDDLSVIGSGPGVPDTSSFEHALRALRDRGLWEQVPASVRHRLTLGVEGRAEETPKPKDARLANACGFVIGSRRDAMAGAREAATRLGYRAVVIEAPVIGDARLAGPAVIERARQEFREGERVCVISSGETTVNVTGSGRGGRNQELTLAALPALAALGCCAVLAGLGTDGVDGPTDAAGAIADERSLSRATALGLPPVHDVLAANDAYPFFDSLGDLIRTGPTGTNVGDLQIVLVSQ